MISASCCKQNQFLPVVQQNTWLLDWHFLTFAINSKKLHYACIGNIHANGQLYTHTVAIYSTAFHSQLRDCDALPAVPCRLMSLPPINLSELWFWTRQPSVDSPQASNLCAMLFCHLSATSWARLSTPSRMLLSWVIGRFRSNTLLNSYLCMLWQITCFRCCQPSWTLGKVSAQVYLKPCNMRTALTLHCPENNSFHLRYMENYNRSYCFLHLL